MPTFSIHLEEQFLKHTVEEQVFLYRNIFNIDQKNPLFPLKIQAFLRKVLEQSQKCSMGPKFVVKSPSFCSAFCLLTFILNAAFTLQSCSLVS